MRAKRKSLLIHGSAFPLFVTQWFCIQFRSCVFPVRLMYQERYEGLVARLDTAKARFEVISELASDKKSRGKSVGNFIAELARQDGLLDEFYERLWLSLVDLANVYSKDDVRFTFKNGTEIQA